MRAAFLVLSLLVPIATAAPLPVVETYRETFDAFDANIWFVDKGGGIDCEVGNRGCSLFLAGFSHAEGALPAIASPVGTLSIDVLRAGSGAGESTIELSLDRGWVAASVTASALRLSSSRDPGETSPLPLAPGGWHTIEIELRPLAASLRLLDAGGATLATLGPVDLEPAVGIARTIGITGNEIAEAHHFDNVVVQVRP